MYACNHFMHMDDGTTWTTSLQNITIVLYLKSHPTLVPDHSISKVIVLFLLLGFASSPLCPRQLHNSALKWPFGCILGFLPGQGCWEAAF